jgi:hypothetical protein
MTKEALDLALEALEPMQNSRDDTAIERAITAIKQARSAPVQEPVAWRWVNSKNWLTYGEMPHDKFESTPLYTTPPAQPAYTKEDVDRAFSAGMAEGERLAIETPAAQRPVAEPHKWVGLDDDDISALGLSIAKARALESLLKRRNT